MSGIEDLLVEDIRALSDAVVVTETDLAEARSAVDHRIQSDRRRRRIQMVAVAASVLLAAGLGFAALDSLQEDGTVLPAGPLPTSPDPYEDFLEGAAPTAELLKGLWRVDNGTVVLQFDPDGSMQWSADGAVISDPVVRATYDLDGNDLVVTEVDGTPCRSGREISMRASVPTPGIMHVVVPDQLFGTCLPVSSTMVLEQVLPTSKTLARLRTPSASGWEPLTGEERLFGDWLAQGGGYLLEVSPAGWYYIADDSTAIVDQGRWSLRGADLVLRSRFGSSNSRCETGDRLVLSGVEQVDLGTTGIRGTVTENTCDGGWTPEAWILLPHAGSNK